MSLPRISLRVRAALLATGLIAGSGVPALAADDEPAPTNAQSEDAGTGLLSDAGASATVELRLKGGKYINLPDGNITGKRVVSDNWINTRVKSELLANSVSTGSEVNVATMNGVVFLKGTLANEDAIDHAKDIAARVEGVRSVDTSALVVSGE